MAIQIQGNGGTVAEVDGTGYRAQRVTVRPLDPGSLGSYGLALNSGIMAAGLAANAEIFQFRWTHATNLCVVHKVTFGAIIGGTAFTAGAADFRLSIARSWSADGSGGTAATLTGNNGKKRASYGTTLLNAARIASTGALTAGTKTLDAQGIANLGAGVGATAGLTIVEPGSYFVDPNEPPVILAQNEGLVILATVPATGTWSFGVGVQWTESASY